MVTHPLKQMVYMMTWWCYYTHYTSVGFWAHCVLWVTSNQFLYIYYIIFIIYIYYIYNSNDKRLIYLLSIKTRGKQFIGNTTNNFRSRRNNHKSDVRNTENGSMENVKQTLLENLFLKSDHQDFLEEEKVRLTENIGFWSH